MISPLFIRHRTIRPHNWIGPFGAHLAYATFFIFGLAAYIFPLLLAVFGVGYIASFLAYLRERRLWFGLWSAVLVFSLAGLLDLMDGPLEDVARKRGRTRRGRLARPNPV